MKKGHYLLVIVCLLGLSSFAFVKHEAKSKAEEEAIKDLILKSYVHGAFNELNAEAMKKGFHEDFAIYSAKGEAISKYPIAAWTDGVAKRKANDYDAKDPKNKWEHKFASVDVTGGAAQVKIELFNQGKQVYTDYLSLLKFDSGWRIVAKVYNQH
ncbi:nuclear transport factor 2 family protein [uncultured Roseivirga sp.]|uniref:nuclear transport factor 2 family protein n=1 Tax=uncultured Roseivirga sp. TaxID=543088 RepID=UPI0030D74021|tara:strand:- start:285613 stop:286077 length:465 start_codon:yes stop_codon:yes gene_type:complete